MPGKTSRPPSGSQACRHQGDLRGDARPRALGAFLDTNREAEELFLPSVVVFFIGPSPVPGRGILPTPGFSPLCVWPSLHDLIPQLVKVIATNAKLTFRLK